MNNLLESLPRASDKRLELLLEYAKEAYINAIRFAEAPQQDYWAAVIACIEIEQARRVTP